MQNVMNILGDMILYRTEIYYGDIKVIHIY